MLKNFIKLKQIQQYFKISYKHLSNTYFQIENKSNYLRVKDNNNNYHDFHYFWLRHNCSCFKGCNNAQTKERTISTTDFPIDVYPLTQTLSKDNILTIEWSDANHVSKFDMNYLIENSYAKNITHVNEPIIKLSDVEIDYNKYKTQTLEYFKDCKIRLDTYGSVIVRNRGIDTEAIIQDFGGELFHSHFGRLEDLKTDNTTNKNTDQLGN